MPAYRKTAIVELTLPSDDGGARPLTWEREYGAIIHIEGRDYSAQNFRSPRNDEQWREYNRRLRDCNKNRDSDQHRGAILIRTFGRDLYTALAALTPRLEEFLQEPGTPRRLVIKTRRPELHALPWGALYDVRGRFLAAGDLSIVQCYEHFSPSPETTEAKLNLRTQFDADTPSSTSKALEGLPAEITRVPQLKADILHIEAHGDVVNGAIGDAGGWAYAQSAGEVKIALLWSCFSAATDPWGESPALCLHRNGAAFVLSFQVELHIRDADAISRTLYGDVFGAKASRDIETAVVRIRAAQFKEEFTFSVWASMTAFLRNPLDMSAMPLGGPRAPKSGWKEEASPGDEWADVVEQTGGLKPGSIEAVKHPVTGALPDGLVSGWKGTVIRLDGVESPLPDATIAELDLEPQEAPKTHPADRLLWFFGKIAHYGAPLVVWTSVTERQLGFLKTVHPPRGLTFLVLYADTPEPTIVDLVDHNLLEEALKMAETQSEDAGDESLQAAYMAFVRNENQWGPALNCLDRFTSESEKLLLRGNYVSRSRRDRTTEGPEMTMVQRWQKEEEYYKDSLSEATKAKNKRDIGRASLELGYLLKSRDQVTAAEQLYRVALENLEQATDRDSRWHSALGRVLRDTADLLATQPARLDEASALLKRGIAIHSYHGRKLQIAYSQATAAKIALTAKDYEEVVNQAVDSANSFEQCKVWRGWHDPVLILLDALMYTGQIERMVAVTDLAIAKIGKSNQPKKRMQEVQNKFMYKKAEALWAAGRLREAGAALDSLNALTASGDLTDEKLKAQIERLRQFLDVK